MVIEQGLHLFAADVGAVSEPSEEGAELVQREVEPATTAGRRPVAPVGARIRARGIRICQRVGRTMYPRLASNREGPAENAGEIAQVAGGGRAGRVAGMRQVHAVELWDQHTEE